jgi:hypothetical protein
MQAEERGPVDVASARFVADVAGERRLEVEVEPGAEVAERLPGPAMLLGGEPLPAGERVEAELLAVGGTDTGDDYGAIMNAITDAEAGAGEASGGEDRFERAAGVADNEEAAAATDAKRERAAAIMVGGTVGGEAGAGAADAAERRERVRRHA